MSPWDVQTGDCLALMKAIAPNSIDAVVTDPPYGLSFMGKEWDRTIPSVLIWTEVRRILKPGGHIVAFGGTRTMWQLGVAIERSGFDIRDTLCWLYGSGFPKSLDVSKAMDKAAGAEREIVGPNRFAAINGNANVNTYGTASRPDETAPATDLARQWDGWGTALKPGWEPIILARKPLIGTVEANVARYGTAAINVDGCRIGTDEDTARKPALVRDTAATERRGGMFGGNGSPLGRWPANVVLDEDAAALLDAQGVERGVHSAGSRKLPGGWDSQNSMFGIGLGEYGGARYGDRGGASRFFYCAKASRSERNAGLDGMPERPLRDSGNEFSRMSMWNGENGDETWRAKNPNTPTANHHPTVKPISLMRWLCRLVTPPNGLILDPFLGSGTTGCAAVMEGFRFLGMEIDSEYMEIAERRIAYWATQDRQLSLIGE